MVEKKAWIQLFAHARINFIISLITQPTKPEVVSQNYSLTKFHPKVFWFYLQCFITMLV